MTSPVVIGSTIAAGGSIIGTGAFSLVVESVRGRTTRADARSAYLLEALTRLQGNVTALSIITMKIVALTILDREDEAEAHGGSVAVLEAAEAFDAPRVRLFDGDLRREIAVHRDRCVAYVSVAQLAARDGRSADWTAAKALEGQVRDGTAALHDRLGEAIRSTFGKS